MRILTGTRNGAEGQITVAEAAKKAIDAKAK
jgi:hypothetical protein